MSNIVPPRRQALIPSPPPNSKWFPLRPPQEDRICLSSRASRSHREVQSRVQCLRCAQRFFIVRPDQECCFFFNYLYGQKCDQILPKSKASTTAPVDLSDLSVCRGLRSHYNLSFRSFICLRFYANDFRDSIMPCRVQCIPWDNPRSILPKCILI